MLYIFTFQVIKYRLKYITIRGTALLSWGGGFQSEAKSPKIDLAHEILEKYMRSIKTLIGFEPNISLNLDVEIDQKDSLSDALKFTEITNIYCLHYVEDLLDNQTRLSSASFTCTENDEIDSRSIIVMLQNLMHMLVGVPKLFFLLKKN